MRKFLTALALMLLIPMAASAQDTKESVSDRVIRTQTLRCGYAIYDPSFMKDANTGAMSGMFYDLTEELGKRLGLKVEWAEETGYGTIAEGFRSNKYDAFCGAVWPTPDRVKGGMFTIPIFYNIVGVLVRKDDTRFDSDYMKLNSPEYTVAVRDGDITHSIAKSRFPNAKQVAIPDLSLTEQQLMEVSLGKADATFNDPYMMYRYNQANPDKQLKDVAAGKPLKYFPVTYMLPPADAQLKQMFDVALGELIAEGIVDDIIKKYEKEGSINLRVAKPYQDAK